MPPSKQNSAPTLGVDKKYLLGKYSMFYKIVISLNMWFKRHELCKSIYIYIWTHEGPRRKKKNNIGTHEGPKVLRKKWAQWRLKKNNIGTREGPKLERDHSYKWSIV